MRRLLCFLALLTASSVGPLAAQTLSARAADIRLGGRLHAQYAASSVAEVNNDFFLRRARFTADLTVSDFFAARVQPEFAGGTAALQDAYITLAPSESFEISMGQFKRGFDLFELSSSTDLSIIERDGRVEGVGGCAGVGGACSYSRLTEKLDFAGRDQGLRLEASRGAVGFVATLTNGTGINVADENDAKSFSGRVTFDVVPGVTLGGQVGVHDYVDPGDENASAVAWAADVEFGGWRDGIHFQAAVVGGDNWKVLRASGEEAAFTAAQAVLSYYRSLDAGRFAGVEPLARVSWADPDGDAADDAALIFTPGLMLYVTGKNKIGFNVDVFAPQAGDTEYSFKIQSFIYF